MKISKNRIYFGAYFIVITVFFLYYLFPSESVRDYCVYRLSQISPDMRINAKSIKLAFPPAFRLYQVDLYYLEQALGSIDNIKINPDLLSLFGKDTALSFSGNAYAGQFSGTAEIASNSPAHQVLIDTTFSGIQVKDIDALEMVADYQISGMLTGELAYKSDSRNQTLRGNFTLSNGSVNFSIPLLSQGSLTFKDLAADVLMNNQTLTIQRCRIQGDQMDASISGTIIYNLQTGKRALDLSGTLNLHHVVLAKLKNSFPVNLLKGGKSGNQGFAFKIKGTLDTPEFSFN